MLLNHVSVETGIASNRLRIFRVAFNLWELPQFLNSGVCRDNRLDSRAWTRLFRTQSRLPRKAPAGGLFCLTYI